MLGLQHRGLESVLAELGHRLGLTERLDARRHERHLQALAVGIETRERGLVGAGFERIGIDDEAEPPAEIVHHCQLVGEHEQDVWGVQFVGFYGMRKALFDVADGVVAEIARQATGETRPAGKRRGPEAGEIGLDEGKRVGGLVLLDDVAVALHRERVLAHADERARRQADDGITAEALAAHHRFQKVGIRRVGELEVERERGVEVGRQLVRERNAVVTLAGELVEFGFGHVQGSGIRIRGSGKVAGQSL